MFHLTFIKMKTFIIYGMESDFGLHWLLILLLIPLIHRLWLDHRTIKKLKNEVDHKKHTIITGALMVLLSFPVWVYGPCRYLFQPILLSWGIFLMFFDYFLNLLVGKSWYYIDEALDGKGSLTDRLWLYTGVWGSLFVKSWILMVTFAVYFYLSRV